MKKSGTYTKYVKVNRNTIYFLVIFVLLIFGIWFANYQFESWKTQLNTDAELRGYQLAFVQITAQAKQTGYVEFKVNNETITLFTPEYVIAALNLTR